MTQDQKDKLTDWLSHELQTGKQPRIGVIVDHIERYYCPPPVPTKTKEEVLSEDHKRLVHELDVIINGENAATQASLCDIVAQLRTGSQQETREALQKIERIVEGNHTISPGEVDVVLALCRAALSLYDQGGATGKQSL